jgi:hypothetical protein
MAQTSGSGRKLSPDQAASAALLAAVAVLTQRDRRPPTCKELMAALGLRSRRQFYRTLEPLVASGRVRRLQGSRGLILTDPQASEVDARMGE